MQKKKNAHFASKTHFEHEYIVVRVTSQYNFENTRFSVNPIGKTVIVMRAKRSDMRSDRVKQLPLNCTQQSVGVHRSNRMRFSERCKQFPHRETKIMKYD
jgi:hypothetical protein